MRSGAAADAASSALASVVIAVAQDGQLRRQTIQQADERQQEIDPLLLHEPRHDRDQRTTGRAEVGQPHPLQRGLPADGLAGQVRPGVRGGKAGVGGRIPDRGVDAVEDADQRVAAGLELVLDAHAFGLGQDLPGVGRAHGDHRVGQPDAAHQRVAAAVPEERFPEVREREQPARSAQPW